LASRVIINMQAGFVTRIAPGAHFTDRNGTEFAFDDVPASVATLPLVLSDCQVCFHPVSLIDLKWSTAIFKMVHHQFQN
jgi:hypothetical protein